MEKFGFDYSHLDNVLNPDLNKISLNDNKHRLIRVAFDFFKLEGDASEDLWQIQSSDDGEEFLVRTFNLSDEDGKNITASDWSVETDIKLANLTVVYKGTPIHRIASVDYGAHDSAEVKMLQETVQNKLNSDVGFVTKMIDSMPAQKVAALKETCGGIFDEIKDWLTSKDITDDVMADVEKATGGRWKYPEGCQTDAPFEVLNEEGSKVGQFMPSEAPDLKLNNEDKMTIRCGNYEGPVSDFLVNG